MNLITLGRQDRPRCAADAHDVTRTTSPTSTPRLQERARGVRGPAVPERAPARRPDHRSRHSRPPACSSAPACASSRREKLYTQGNLQQTGNSLDVAIQGHGFFQVQMPDGTIAYTRDGSLPASTQRPARHRERLRGQPGDHDSRPTRRASPSAATARSACSVAGPGRAAQVGTLQLADFVNPAGLQPRGENLLPGDRLQRPAADRHARPERPGHADAGLARKLERQRGRGAGQHDRDPARLRDELEGDLRPPTRCCSTSPTRPVSTP